MDKGRNIVHINPNFNKNLQNSNGSQIAPHINPLFNGDKKSMLNNLKTTIGNNFFYQPSISSKKIESHGRIYFNPKMLGNFDLKMFEQPKPQPLEKPIGMINKFSKVNPQKPPESNSLTNQIKTLPITTKIRKPCHSLVRNRPIQKPPSESRLLSSNLKKCNNTNFKIENRLSCNNLKTKRSTLQKIVKKYPEKSPLKLRRQSKIVNPIDKSKLSKPKFVYVGGEKYIYSDCILKRVIQTSKPNVQNLKKVTQISINGKIFKRKSENVFTTIKKFNPGQMKKNNITCPIYRKLGKCKKHDNKKCQFVHDPKHVMICKKYLNGACKLEGCFLSHDIVIEKMPTCKFYLKGCCARDNCPYLHVKVNNDANICPEFLQGYCPAGVNCYKVHFEICPVFHKYGKCDVQNCKFPHKHIEINKLNVEKPIESKNIKHDYNKDKTTSNKSKSDISDNVIRYYLESEEQSRQNESQTTDNSMIEEESCAVGFKNRSSVGSLPSFIAI